MTEIEAAPFGILGSGGSKFDLMTEIGAAPFGILGSGSITQGEISNGEAGQHTSPNGALAVVGSFSGNKQPYIQQDDCVCVPTSSQRSSSGSLASM